jgi:hypothetical protein
MRLLLPTCSWRRGWTIPRPSGAAARPCPDSLPRRLRPARPQAFARHGAGVRIPGAELRNQDQPQSALCDPERLTLQIRTAAAALHVPVAIEARAQRFDEPALSRMEAGLFDTSVSCGVTLPPPRQLVCCRMGPELFEPANWAAVRALARRVRERQLGEGCTDELDAAVAAEACAAGEQQPQQQPQPQLHPQLQLQLQQQQQQQHLAQPAQQQVQPSGQPVLA